MVRLQRQKAYVYRTESGENIQHFKHLVNIPDDAIERLGWTQGVELQPVIDGSRLILEPNNGQAPDKIVKSPAATGITPRRKVRR
jgi:hypothetical protein